MTRRYGTTPREFSDSTCAHLAAELATYLQRPHNRGASAWLDTRDFAPADRAAILLVLGDLVAEAA